MKNNKITISDSLLQNIEMALNDSSYEIEWYLDVEEGDATFISDYVEADEKRRELIEDDSEQERFIAIPCIPSHEQWQKMEQFILELDDQDEKTKNLLLTNIQGKGAFRRFKDAMFEVGLIERWYVYKGLEDRRDALNWLLSFDLITNEDVEEGLKRYEQELLKRKQRREEIVAIGGGMQVKCLNNLDHEDKLTVGKAYESLDEQKQNKNIRIRDDRGKLVWLGKHHFGLTND